MIDYLMRVLDVFLNGADFMRVRREKKSRIISLIKKALRNTKKHIEKTRTGDYDDIQSEELASQWAEAAEAIRPFSPRTAQTFEDKSDYWTNPHGFTDDIQHQKRRFDDLFTLEAVERTLAELKRKWKL